jgi:pilus assembly protein CpaF
VFEYLETLIASGRTPLVVGEVGTGKTTLTRALAATFPSDESILVIEDTPEIRLEHPNVRYLRTRDVNSEGMGKISPSEVIRAGMRMAMNRIVFGEIRDAGAAEAFIDVCSSGHSGISTLHARGIPDTIVRLELLLARAQSGVGRHCILQQIATAVQAIVYVALCPITGKRRIYEVVEIGPFADGNIRQRPIFSYFIDSSTKLSSPAPAWKVNQKVSGFKDFAPELGMLSKLPNVLHIE